MTPAENKIFWKEDETDDVKTWSTKYERRRLEVLTDL